MDPVQELCKIFLLKFNKLFRPIYYSYLYPNAKIFGIEHIKALALWSKGNIAKYAKKLNLKNIKIIAADGRKGLPKEGPFDFIHCGAGNYFYIYEIIYKFS